MFISAYKLCQNKSFVYLTSVHKENFEQFNSNRIDARVCFINLEKIKSNIPYENEIINGKYKFSWNESFGKKYEENDKIYFHSNNLYYIYPTNDNNILSDLNIYRNSIESGMIIPEQINKVNLIPGITKWIKKCDSNIVIYINVKSITNEKLKRMFDGLRNQTYQDFSIIYVDDASDNFSNEYAKFMLDYDNYFKSKNIIYMFNKIRMGELQNIYFVMNNIITNPDSIIINLEENHYFIDNKAIEIIINEFNKGADVAFYNYIRYDKPLNQNKIHSFRNIFERNADDIWLHPICFRKKLFDSITEEDLKINNKFIEVNTKLAIMIPIFCYSINPVFIEKILYYFEPSIENKKIINDYNEINKDYIRNIILERNRKTYNNKLSSNK